MSQGIIVCRRHEIGDGLTGMKELDNQVVAAKFDDKNTFNLTRQNAYFSLKMP